MRARTAATRDAYPPVVNGVPTRACLTRTARFCVSFSWPSSSFTERRSFHSLALKLSDLRQYINAFIRRYFCGMLLSRPRYASVNDVVITWPHESHVCCFAVPHDNAVPAA